MQRIFLTTPLSNLQWIKCYNTSGRVAKLLLDKNQYLSNKYINIHHYRKTLLQLFVDIKLGQISILSCKARINCILIAKNQSNPPLCAVATTSIDSNYSQVFSNKNHKCLEGCRYCNADILNDKKVICSYQTVFPKWQDLISPNLLGRQKRRSVLSPFNNQCQSNYVKQKHSQDKFSTTLWQILPEYKLPLMFIPSRLYTSQTPPRMRPTVPGLNINMALFELSEGKDDALMKHVREFKFEGMSLQDMMALTEDDWEDMVDLSKLKKSESAIYNAHKEAVQKGSRFYEDPTTGYVVMTREAHRHRGTCCGNACRHCPFGQIAVNPALREKFHFNSAFFV